MESNRFSKIRNLTIRRALTEDFPGHVVVNYSRRGENGSSCLDCRFPGARNAFGDGFGDGGPEAAPLVV